jgi:hypothetical protein
MPPMKPLVICLPVVVCAVLMSGAAQGQTFAGGDKANAQLEVLTKKIDEQNMKIDALSQQILKLEQQIAARPPGVVIGEPTPASRRACSGSGCARHRSAERQRSRRRERRDADFHCEDAQSGRLRVAEVQPHRKRPRLADRADDHDPDCRRRFPRCLSDGVA